MDDKILRFLNGEPIPGDKVGYMTFPRSGNTFLRKYMEMITGVPTGSEMPSYITMPLQLTGLIGENTVDDTTWIVKSHHPMRIKFDDFSCNKLIVCVRDPFDVMRSGMNFMTTKTHSKLNAIDIPIEDPELF